VKRVQISWNVASFNNWCV